MTENRRSANRLIMKAQFLHLIRLKQVASVKYRFIFHRFGQQFKIGGTEHRPFGHDHQCVSAIGSFILVFTIGYSVTYLAFNIFYGFRIIRMYTGAWLEQCLNVVKRWRLTDIICVGFKSKSPDGNLFPLKVSVKIGFQFRKQLGFLHFIHFHHSIEYFKIVSMLLRGFAQGLNVFRETTASIPDTG